MRVTLRARLGAIVGTSALAFVVLIVAGTVAMRRTQSGLQTIERRYLPKVDLQPRLEAQLERLQRTFQDAVSAHDPEALGASGEIKGSFFGLLADAEEALDRNQVTALRAALEDYDRSASELARRLIRGETGEAVVGAMSAMQAKRNSVADLIGATTAFERGELALAFSATAHTLEESARVRLYISIACLLTVISLSIWIGRGVLRTVASLTEGLERFGAGDFDHPIVIRSQDELGDVARRANAMADSLRRLSSERDRNDWLKAGLANLTRELHGELEPAEVARRAVRCLAKTLEAPAAALYTVDDGGGLVLAAAHALEGAAPETATRQFRRGEGLVGQAALQEDLTVITDPPADYLRIRSGLGSAVPRALVLLPLVHSGQTLGVLELATFKPWTELSGELLLSVRETLAIGLAVARARVATRELLAATQRQAERLATQEEELRATNEELQVQEEELRQTNADLSQQTDKLEAQGRVLAAQNAELDDIRVRLEQRAAELARVSTYKSQFLANMSHELRTPLNSMLLLSNLLADNEGGTLSAKQVEFARTIHSAGKDLLALINQVLDLAKVESGRQDVEVAPVDLDQVLAHLSSVFLPLAREKNLEFRTHRGPDVPATISTDRRRLEQILTNLLGNAIKFTARGEVSFRIERAAADARFQRPELAQHLVVAFHVSDTELGIAPEDRERIFAPFEQVDGAVDRRYGGTGLGLGIARELAALMGGELQLASELGVGSTFSCFLPAAQAPAATARAPLGDVKPPAAGEPYLLLIEDDPVFASTFGDVIASHGLRYVHARSGHAGLRIARDRRPQGIILDVTLPDTDGWQVMEALRADAATADIPVHFVSALDGAERGLAMGAIGYLRKPVTRIDLVNVIDALVPPATARNTRFLVVEDDALTASSVVRMLEAERLVATRVSSAEQALELLRRERFGCMILDLSLPEMSGLDLLRTLRDEAVPDPPRVVVHTARSLSRDEMMTIEAYAEAIVLKDGASSERLLDEVRLFVRRFNTVRPNGRGKAPELLPADVRLEGHKVLLADDDMRTVYALSATLRAKGLEVIVADNGQAALDALDRRPDVEAVLMDIMMPEMDGYEAMRRIRADGRFDSLPIVALTAKAMKGDEEKCVEAGASHYMPKPIDVDRLMALIARCLVNRVEVQEVKEVNNDG
jgi:CheY-like chemotaxis protein/signal transduction histidine kinase